MSSVTVRPVRIGFKVRIRDGVSVRFRFRVGGSDRVRV